MKIISKNKVAKFDYELIDKYEAGISLIGSEVKSIRNGDVDLTSSYIFIDKNNNAQWINGFIKKYEFNTQDNSYNEKRTRQLLLKKREIKNLKNDINLKKLTIIPYIIYLDKNNKVKLEIYTAKGRKKQDKREYIKERDYKKEVKKYY